MLRAASLIYAIFISLVIGILCYIAVLLFSLNINLENHFDFRQRMLLNNSSAIAYLKSEYVSIDHLEKIKLFPNENDMTTFFKESPWGLFKKFTIITTSKEDSVRQDVLMAERHIRPPFALYLRDNDNELKIAGNTVINGDIFVGGRGLKKISISGNSGFYEPKQNGKILKSNKIMPPQVIPILEYPQDYKLLFLEDLPENNIINTFKQKTILLEVGPLLENIKLKGNIIIRSNDTLKIAPTAFLEDVIIEAPKVVFQKGVQATTQVFCTYEIILEDDVKLTYPSALVVNSENPELEKLINVGGNSTVSGVVLLYGGGQISEDKNVIIIEENAEIIGDVYCDGKLSIYGTIKGSAIASSLLHKTENTHYDNLIFNGKILTSELPQEFFQITVLKNFESEGPIIIKKL